MAWWIWVLGGLGLLVAEVTLPGGFFSIFFGFGAILVGVAKALGWEGPAWAEWLAFSALSVAGLLFFRKPLTRRFALDALPVDRIEGETALVLEDVAPNGVGKAELRGSSWNARTQDALPLARGQRCRVERVEGLTLWLRAE